MSDIVKIGRLAFRHEGQWWNAYVALADTMQGALLIGSIAMAGVQRKDRKEAFMRLMRDVHADLIEGATGKRPEFLEAVRAPEHERAGHG